MRHQSEQQTKVAGTVGWIVLAVAWATVMWRGAGPTPGMVLSPLLLMVGASALMALWVHHNLAIHRRRGARHAIPAVIPVYASDRLGRRLTVDDTSRFAPRWVEIDLAVQADRKHYFRP